MQLRLLTDIGSDNAPLSYVLEEFLRIQNAGFGFELADRPPADLYYTAEPPPGPGLWIPRRQGSAPEPTWIDLGELAPDPVLARRPVPVLADSFSSAAAAAVPFDLFHNAFIWLSRFEEHALEERGAPIQSYSTRRPCRDGRVFEVPTVNYLFLLLQRLIEKEKGPGLFGPPLPPRIDFSHDLDYIAKTLPLRLKQTAFCGFNAARSLARGRLGAGGGFCLRGLRFGLLGGDYWRFDDWLGWERAAGVRSTFYVYAGTPGRGAKNRVKRWLMDPGYDVAADPRLRDKLRELDAAGWELGLHGSFDSADDPELLALEKSRLESALGRPVTRARQHWLRFTHKTLRALVQAGFEFDSTLGFNDRMGFRAGIASEFRPYDFENRRAHRITEIPLVLMDSHIFDYASNDPTMPDRARALLDEAMLFPGAVSVDWHQRVCHPDYGWERPCRAFMEEYGAGE